MVPSGNSTWLLKMAIEIVSFPIEILIFHGYVNVYQRVSVPLENLMASPQWPLALM